MKNTQKKLSIGLLIALVGFPQISETIYTPALPSVARGLKASASMVEMTLAIYFLGFAVGVLLWGTISDWYGRRPAMLLGLVVYGIGTLGCANSTSVEALLAWRFLQAFGASVGSVITQTILRDSYEGADRIKLFSIMSAALAFSPAIGPLLGGFISELWGWRANFWILALLAFGLSIWSFFSLPETRPTQTKALSFTSITQIFIEMMKSRLLRGHILLIGSANGILFGFYQEAPFIFIEHLGMKPSSYGLFGLLIAGATILAARLSYLKSSRYSPEFMIQRGAACVLAGGLILTLTVLLNTGSACLCIPLFLIFFGIGLIIPNSLSKALKAYQAVAGTAGSLFGGCYYCLIAGCTWLMSLLHNGSLLPLPLYMTFLGLVIAFASRQICSSQSSSLELQKAQEK